ncbi:hypothetical protein [Wukongibacter sp. M2B1]|uniref:hypothetical protein n=1 Tax=Wukongibacter sp. M2B1 TaxID=3088895 RepID=UPI003D7AC957
MKENSKSTPEIQSINSKIDDAIDKMDVEEVERQLAKLSEERPLSHVIEDSKVFAKRIIKQNRKGVNNMRRSMNKSVILVACLVLTIGATVVYGSDLFKKFMFYNQKTTVEIRTNQNISQGEAERLAKDAEDDYNSPSSQGTTEKAVERTFSSIEEVEEATGIKIILPSYIPEDFQIEKDISVYNTLNNNYNIYINYRSKEKENRLLGVTIITQDLLEDSTVVTVTDAVHKDEYKTPSGTNYSILKEDEGTIATTDINNIKYAIIFMGVNEEEMNRVINSVDLSSYIE